MVLIIYNKRKTYLNRKRGTKALNLKRIDSLFMELQLAKGDNIMKFMLK